MKNLIFILLACLAIACSVNEEVMTPNSSWEIVDDFAEKSKSNSRVQANEGLVLEEMISGNYDLVVRFKGYAPPPSSFQIKKVEIDPATHPGIKFNFAAITNSNGLDYSIGVLSADKRSVTFTYYPYNHYDYQKCGDCLGLLLSIYNEPNQGFHRFKIKFEGQESPFRAATNVLTTRSGAPVTVVNTTINNVSYATINNIEIGTAPPAIPNVPTNVLAQYLIGPKYNKVTWVDNSSNETGFVIEYRRNGGAWSSLTTQTGTTYFHSNILPNTGTYDYRVKAINANGSSAWVLSNSVYPQ